MKTQLQKMATDVAERLDEIAEELEGLEDWALDMGCRAIEHKLQETLGRLTMAQAAAWQYANGTLEPR